MRIIKVPRHKPRSVPVNPAPTTKEKFAAHLRRNATDSERAFCALLDQYGVTYQFQPVMLGFIPDFYIPARRLVIELDGKFHKTTKERDKHKNKIFKSHGYKVRRIASHRIFTDADGVLAFVYKHILLKPFDRRSNQSATEHQESPEMRDDFESLDEQFLRATKGL